MAISLALGWCWCATPSAAAAPPLREAPNPAATPSNQLLVSGNACGPAALLSAFRFGDKNWQQVADNLLGTTERGRLMTVVRTWGVRPSRHLSKQLRYNRHGVNVDDLCDMANEMARPYLLPAISSEILFLKPRETKEALLARTHAHLAASLAKGLPPVISLRRLALRREPGAAPAWITLQGHFVTIIALPRKLDKHATSFAVTYLDPWGGKRATGMITALPPAAPPAPGSPAPVTSACLEADFPQATVGKTQLRKGEGTALTLAAAIGAW